MPAREIKDSISRHFPSQENSSQDVLYFDSKKVVDVVLNLVTSNDNSVAFMLNEGKSE